jgi:hypothetical protein
MHKKYSSKKTVLGPKRFAAITAVEGLKLSAAATNRQREMDAQNLSPAQRRAEIIRAYQESPKKRNG